MTRDVQRVPDQSFQGERAHQGAGDGGRRYGGRGRQRSPRTPQRRAADHDHQSAARRSARGAPYFWDPDMSRSIRRSRNRPTQHGHQASLYRRAVGRRSGLERRAAISCGRHSQQPADAWAGRGHVSVFRPVQQPTAARSTFRAQLSCDITRRVVRYENDGTSTVLGNRLGQEAELLTASSRIRMAATGTDPPYGGSSMRASPTSRRPQQPPASSIHGSASRWLVPGKRELPTNCYRVDPSGRIDLVVTEEQVPDRTASASRRTTKKRRQHRQGPGDTGPGGKANLRVRCRRRQQLAISGSDCIDRRIKLRTRMAALRRRWQHWSQQCPAAMSATA